MSKIRFQCIIPNPWYSCWGLGQRGLHSWGISVLASSAVILPQMQWARGVAAGVWSAGVCVHPARGQRVYPTKLVQHVHLTGVCNKCVQCMHPAGSLHVEAAPTTFSCPDFFLC